MADLYEFAVMSQQAREPNGGTPPAGWTLFVPPTEGASTGFQGVAYRNTQTNEIVVAFRGTELTQGGDLQSDLQIGLGNVPAQYADAQAFYTRVLGEANAKIDGTYTVALTGTSLGGGLAQLLGAQTGLTTATFNAPGMMDIWVNQFGGNPNGFYDNINNYNTLGDIVHKWDTQIGSKINVMGSSFGPVPDELEPLIAWGSPALKAYYLYDQHGIDQFVRLFSGTTDNRPGYWDTYGPRIKDAISSLYTSAQTWTPRRDPLTLTLDLNADGLETVALNPTNPIYFDHDGDGVTTATGWISPDDGFLALDRNGNSTIDSGRELFGDNTPLSGGGTAANGYAALADLDSNGDGVINSNDAQFANLRIWQDLNQNGISESNELSTLAQKNIVSINTASTLHSQVLADGNRIADLGSYTKDTGETDTTASGSAADVDLSENTFYSNFTDTVPLTPEAQALPNMQGSGAIPDIKDKCSPQRRKGRKEKEAWVGEFKRAA